MSRSHKNILALTPGGRGATGTLAEIIHEEAGFLWARMQTGLDQAGIVLPKVAIVSTFPNEGALALTANLAIFLAREGKRVAFIETDPRNSCLVDHFQVQRGPGLKELLAGHADLDRLQRCKQLPGLSLIGCGHGRINAETLSTHLADTLDDLSRRHDVVLAHAPPLRTAPESPVIVRHLDTVILAVRADRTPKDEVQRSLLELHELGVPVAGTVLNDVHYELPSGIERFV